MGFVTCEELAIVGGVMPCVMACMFMLQLFTTFPMLLATFPLTLSLFRTPSTVLTCALMFPTVWLVLAVDKILFMVWPCLLNPTTKPDNTWRFSAACSSNLPNLSGILFNSSKIKLSVDWLTPVLADTLFGDNTCSAVIRLVFIYTTVTE